MQSLLARHPVGSCCGVEVLRCTARLLCADAMHLIRAVTSRDRMEAWPRSPGKAPSLFPGTSPATQAPPSPQCAPHLAAAAAFSVGLPTVGRPGLHGGGPVAAISDIPRVRRLGREPDWRQSIVRRLGPVSTIPQATSTHSIASTQSAAPREYLRIDSWRPEKDELLGTARPAADPAAARSGSATATMGRTLQAGTADRGAAAPATSDAAQRVSAAAASAGGARPQGPHGAERGHEQASLQLHSLPAAAIGGVASESSAANGLRSGLPPEDCSGTAAAGTASGSGVAGADAPPPLQGRASDNWQTAALEDTEQSAAAELPGSPAADRHERRSSGEFILVDSPGAEAPPSPFGHADQWASSSCSTAAAAAAGAADAAAAQPPGSPAPPVDGSTLGQVVALVAASQRRSSEAAEAHRRCAPAQPFLHTVFRRAAWHWRA